MWVKVDDGFPGHVKVARATAHLGGGPAAKRRVLAVWLEALCHANQHMTDGFISDLDVKGFTSDRKSVDVLSVFCFDDVRLMARVTGGYRFHKYEQYQPLAEKVKERRRRDLARKRGKSAPDSTRNPSVPDPGPFVHHEDQRGDAAPRTLTRRSPEPEAPNVRALTALAHDVIERAGNTARTSEGFCAIGDLVHALKGRAAQARMTYDGSSARKAIESALTQRRRLS